MRGETGHRVVIVGGRLAGVAAAKALRRAPVEVTAIVVDGDVEPPIRDVLRDRRNARVALGDVIDVELERRRVTCCVSGYDLQLVYDSLIVGTGSTHSGEFAAHAPGLKTTDDALEVRRRIVVAFELGELERDAARRAAWRTFVVVGAGPSGVATACRIAELSCSDLRSSPRGIDSAARIVLVDGSPRVLPTFAEPLGRAAVAKLERMGVEIRTRTRVVGTDDESVLLRTNAGRIERLEARTTIWAAAAHASPLANALAAQSAVEPTPDGRLPVLPDYTLPGHPNVFVVGDLMALDGVSAVGDVAIRSGLRAATQIRRRLDRGPSGAAPSAAFAADGSGRAHRGSPTAAAGGMLGS